MVDHIKSSPPPAQTTQSIKAASHYLKETRGQLGKNGADIGFAIIDNDTGKPVALGSRKLDTNG